MESFKIGNQIRINLQRSLQIVSSTNIIVQTMFHPTSLFVYFSKIRLCLYHFIVKYQRLIKT